MHVFNVSTCEGKASNYPSKAVVGVDWPMKALSMHIKKATLGENCLGSHSCHFVKKLFEPNSFMYNFKMSTWYGQSIKLLHQKLW